MARTKDAERTQAEREESTKYGVFDAALHGGQSASKQASDVRQHTEATKVRTPVRRSQQTHHRGKRKTQWIADGVGLRRDTRRDTRSARTQYKQLRSRISGKCRLLHGRCLILCVKKQSLGFGFSKAET